MNILYKSPDSLHQGQQLEDVVERSGTSRQPRKRTSDLHYPLVIFREVLACSICSPFMANGGEANYRR